MVNPWLTLFLDIVLIGSAVAIVAAMVTEYRTHRLPHVGLSRGPRAARRNDPFVARTHRPAVGSARRRLAA